MQNLEQLTKVQDFMEMKNNAGEHYGKSSE